MMKASNLSHCAECGGELPPGLPRGLCPQCALRADIGSTQVEDFSISRQGSPLPRAFGDYELLEEIARAAWASSIEHGRKVWTALWR
jgi:hypothetical protein